MRTDYLRQLHEYCEAHSSAPPDYLLALERETHLKTLAPQMMSGPLQGRLLALLSGLLRPQRILEIGTFTGYGALCLAEGLAPGGELHTIEANAELAYLIRKYVSASPFAEAIRLHIGQAQEIIPQLPGDFDLVFMDAGKQDYPAYYDLVVDRIRPGGLLLADNVLWSGKVLDPGKDVDAQVLDGFNKRLRADARLEVALLPLRDGLLIARRKP
jgi:predicted O-methyltransferase YrrM